MIYCSRMYRLKIYRRKMDFLKKHPIAKTVILTLFFFCPILGHTQDVIFEFANTLSDATGQYSATNYDYTDLAVITNGGVGFDHFTSDSAYNTEDGDTHIRLAQDDFLGLSTVLAKEFESSVASQVNVHFRFEVDEPVSAPSPCCPTTIYRSVLATNGRDSRELGFSLSIVKEEERYYPVLLVGGGTLDEDGILLEGYYFSFADIFPDKWVDVSLIFRLGGEQPKIDVLIDGAPFTALLSDESKLDLAALRAHLQGGPVQPSYPGHSEMQLFVGGFPFSDPRGADIILDIDRLTIQSPKQAANTEELRKILTDFTQHVSGEVVLGSEQLQSDVQNFLSTFNGEWDEIEEQAMAYLTAFETANEPLFSSRQQIDPGDLPEEGLLTYFLQQWMFDNLFTNEGVASVADIKFEAAEVFPGVVDPSAPRVRGEVEIDATYFTDPAIKLNNQQTVIRPTGFYAPPGEPISIQVSEAAASAGLKLRVGIQRVDLEQGWSIYNRFPRISKLFDINSSDTLVANPFGGGLYFEIPDGTELGVIEAVIDGAVKMPMFSTLELAGHSQDLEAFRAETAKWHLPWFELHGKNLSATLSMNIASLYQDPAAVLEIWDSSFDQVNRMAGRPLTRFRPEWLAFDRQVTVRGTALTASYPLYPDQAIGEPGVDWETDASWFSLLLYLIPNFFEDQAPLKDQREYNNTLWHEWGHMHNLPTLEYHESESNVHLLAVIIYNQVLGADIDTALRFSGFQDYDRDDAALDTMFSPNWQKGLRLSTDDWDNELRYQTRSWARLVEIAGLYGWDAVGAIHKAFYDRGVADGKAYNYGITDDDFIETGSIALNMNLGPIFEFWGVPPSPALAERLQQYPAPIEFRERLRHYRILVPATQSEFVPVFDKLVASTGVRARWDYWLENFDASVGKTITDRIDSIECRYFGCDSQSYFTDNTLVLSVVSVGEDFYRLELNLTNASTLEFQVGAVEVLTDTDTDTDNMVTFSDGKLHIPSLLVGTISYRVELTFTDVDSLIFTLTAIEEL